MSRFELLKLLDEDFSVRNLWKMVRFCNDMPEKNCDPTIAAVCKALDRLATLRDGVPVDADLALEQNRAVRILAIGALKGKKHALTELNKMKFENQ